MRQFFAKYRFFGLFFLLLSLPIIFLMRHALTPKKRLPFYTPAMVNPSLVDSTLLDQKQKATIAPFKLINQNGDTITQATFKDKIYVANFIFTTCLTICPIMTSNMVQVQQKVLNDDEVLLLSHSVTPQIDSVPRLRAYAKEKGVVSGKWHVVTGDKKQIYDLARKSYLAVKTEGNGSEFDMIHTENFILVDKEKHIRGYYDGTNTDDIAQLLEDIEILKRSYLD